jgi:antitoxin CptB
MKELDVLLLRYLEHHYPHSGDADRQAFARIIELQDPELFGYLVGRDLPPDASLRDVIARIRLEA